MQSERASGLVQDWMLKVSASFLALLIFFMTLRYASTHVFNPNAPLRPAQSDVTLNAPAATPRTGLALPFLSTSTAAPLTTQSAITRTRQS